MPDNEAPSQAFYDHEIDEPRATGRRRRQVADWGVGEDVFDRLPSRRFSRGEHSPAEDRATRARRDQRADGYDARDERRDEPSQRRPRRRPAADWLAEVSPRAETRTIVIEGDAAVADAPRRAIVIEGDVPVADAPRRAIVIEGDVPEADAPRRAIVIEADAAVADEPRRAIVIEGGAEPPDEPRREVLRADDAAEADEPRRPSGEIALRADGPRPRRTIVIGGHPDKLPAPRPRRPPRTAMERVGASPDRLAAYAVGLGLLLILIAVLTTGH